MVENSYLYHATLGWDQNPERMKKTQNKDHLYIQKKRKCDEEEFEVGDDHPYSKEAVVKRFQKENESSKTPTSFPATQHVNGGACVEIPTFLESTFSPCSWKTILNDNEVNDNIDQKEISQQCEAIWPEKDCQNPIFELILSPGMPSEKITKRLLTKYKIVQYKISQSVWEAIKETVNSSMYTGVQVKTDLAAGKVYLVGKSKKVTEMNPTFRNLLEETTREIEKNNQGLTVVVPMSPAYYQVMYRSGLEKKMMEKFPELKIDYNVETKEIQISGLRSEVLTAKREIDNIQEQIKTKFLQLNPHLVQFLMLSDGKLSSCLFVPHNINALLQIDVYAVKLIAYSEEVLKKAEEKMKGQLMCRCIFVEQKSLLGSPEWKSLLSCVNMTLNAEKCTVKILEFPSGVIHNVVITGLTSNVQKCHQKVNDFLKNNTRIRTDVPVGPRLKMKFLLDRRRDIWGKIHEKVNVMKNGNRMCLSGPRVHVQEAVLLIKNYLSSLHCDTLHIDKPGAKKFCMINEKVLAAAAKEEFNCAIHLEEASRKRSVLGDPRFQVKLLNGLTIAIYKGDLCRHRVDVIVNAANENLQHIGGLAKAILNAAGHKLQEDCDSIIKTNGRLSAGDSVITDAGNLPCKQVIHTVGPRWSASSHSDCELLLQKAITSSLQLASKNNHCSIAIPAVSSGIFAFPLKSCIENIMEAVRVYVENQQTTLQRIHLVDANEETVKAFCEVTKAKFDNQANSVSPKAPEIQHDVKDEVKDEGNPQVQVTGGNENAVITKTAINIKLLQKNIEDCMTDVIINSVSSSLDMSVYLISKALLSRAGPNLQQLLSNASSGAQVSPGSIFNTSGANLNCQQLLHVVPPAWENGQGDSEKILRDIIKNCLTMTEQNQRKSISFPAIGTGGLGFPKALVASVMLDEIFQFSSSKTRQNLQEVHLVIHPSDGDTMKEFSSQLAKYSDATTNETTNQNPAGTESTFFGAVTTPSPGVHEMTVGSVTYQVKIGDLTKEDAEIIVNSSNRSFTLRAGLSKAILEAAGTEVEESARKLGAQPNKGYIITQAGNLTHCKWILHVADANQPATIKRLVLDALQECENHQATSVAFPALGTGEAKIKVSAAADSVLDAVVDFTKSKLASSLKTVKVVLFQETMLNDFYESMKKREETAPPQPESGSPGQTESVMEQEIKKPVPKLSSIHMVNGIEPVVFSLCADKKENLNKTKTWLQEYIKSAQTEKVITEECVAEIEEAEMPKISDLQKKFQVSVTYKPPDPSIRIVGLIQDVMSVSGGIEMILNRIKENKNRERAAELIGKVVEWRYEHGENMVPFNKMANLELEEAKNGNQTQITIQSQGSPITVSLDTKTATDKQGNQIRIQRVIRHEEDFLRLPLHWKPIDNTLVMEVDVPSGSPEYSKVEQKFQKSCKNKILKILRVQNRSLWLNYQIKKHQVDTKNGSTNNEMMLFHGTDSNSIQRINHHGFNRNYAGRNAACYGNGTYFAVNATYSAQDTYSKPDGCRQKHMYLARVLTGVYSNGASGMMAPPAKYPANPTDLYDSVTDNKANPVMFVIFNDIQAYPEYHIIFQQ